MPDQIDLKGAFNMAGKIVAAIGRQYGSGGREIGKRLAQALDVPFYDRELIKLAAEKSGMNYEVLRDADEKPTNSLLYALATGDAFWGKMTAGFYEMPVTDKLFLVQADIIREIAANGSCVIVGRCADYILADEPACSKIFITAEKATRIKRAVEVYGVPPEKAEDVVNKTDKKRENYHNYYADSKWGLAENYDITLSSSTLGIDGTVDILKAFLLKRA